MSEGQTGHRKLPFSDMHLTVRLVTALAILLERCPDRKRPWHRARAAPGRAADEGNVRWAGMTSDLILATGLLLLTQLPDSIPIPGPDVSRCPWTLAWRSLLPSVNCILLLHAA